jgi:hypothetical protein
MRIWIRIDLAPWIRIRIKGNKAGSGSAPEANVDQQHSNFN